MQQSSDVTICHGTSSLAISHGTSDVIYPATSDATSHVMEGVMVPVQFEGSLIPAVPPPGVPPGTEGAEEQPAPLEGNRQSNSQSFRKHGLANVSGPLRVSPGSTGDTLTGSAGAANRAAVTPLGEE